MIVSSEYSTAETWIGRTDLAFVHLGDRRHVSDFEGLCSGLVLGIQGCSYLPCWTLSRRARSPDRNIHNTH